MCDGILIDILCKIVSLKLFLWIFTGFLQTFKSIGIKKDSRVLFPSVEYHTEEQN